MTKTLVIGATGFTGSYVVPRLLEQGYHVRCLVRSPGGLHHLPINEVELVRGDMDDGESLSRALHSVDVLVNIASIGFGHAPGIVAATLASGVSRALFLSTTAIFTTLNAPSKVVREAAESSIQTSGLAYTILRPTMIYGSSRDRNMCRLVRYVQRWPVIPIFGDGEFLQQPVYVDDVAQAVVQALAAPETVNQAYNIAGYAPLTYNQVIDTVCALMEKQIHKLHMPVAPIVAVLQVLERIGLRLPLKAEQILRLNEHKTFDYTAAAKDFGYAPRSFADGMKLELAEMGILHQEKGKTKKREQR
jgi:nucleoside-diphosphate-sugar epimerase